MANTATDTKNYTWLWWVLGITGIAALGTTVWYFFFRKESKYAQEQAKKKEQNNSSSQGTTSQGTTSQGSGSDAGTANVAQPPHIITPPANNPPPKTSPPVTPPKEEKPKVLGDVFNDIYAPNAKKKITTASRNGKALMQALLNNFNDSGMIKVDGYWGPASEDAYQRAKNKVRGTVGTRYGGAATQPFDIWVADMATKDNWIFKADMDDLMAYVRKIPAKDVFLS